MKSYWNKVSSGGMTTIGNRVEGRSGLRTTPNWFLNFSNATRCNGFVIPSATISTVGT
ncbi:predicted protein [Pyrenophora tritici-repentis Pt-1C-BFP]|uniref:Uncharacterized protein n=1 Tax=Pyrenophora tritici-repentis (strain Pt-1C-BFP) TaxID=426418 RepID=B2W1Y3_PYRTR|nr:uncharacterized protein PTRG_03431 [Pyrenophora tritici-repentis Pt-1C-BFP]EDU46269.1 predicted protein [Pyrenophora tritici-repentis Pt-1C-BFP]